jgi:hypothetical protein
VQDSADLRSRVQAFLIRHNTMTLATVNAAGAVQAAAVFYAADEALNLIFVSSPNSRHSVNLARQPLVAATIQTDNQAWQTIQGVQVEGTAQMVEGAAELVHAVQIYVRRFEFLRGLLDGAASGPAVLRGPLASSRFYVLRPAWIRLIDNTQGFGHKEELHL